jgi:[acyl-carrier-protein] S-malonyltransferase
MMGSGQGTQFLGMGKKLAAKYPYVEELFSIAHSTLGFDLKILMADGPEEELNLTSNAQPAIVLFSIMICKILEV